MRPKVSFPADTVMGVTAGQHISPVFRALQRMWSAASRLLGPCPLPPLGEQVPHVLLDPWAVQPGFEATALPLLLAAALRFLRTTTAASFAAFGVPRSHPAFGVCRRFFFLPYWSAIYTVAWPETPVPVRSPGRQFQLPLGTL